MPTAVWACGWRDDADVKEYRRREADSAIESAAKSSGHTLPSDLRGHFESSLGADLSGVRIHTGGESHDAAAAVRAQAFTVGQDIHFAAGQYDPGTSLGRLLIAHEVAHTVQQQGDVAQRQHKPEVSSPRDAAEVEADGAAAAMVSGQAFQVTAAPLAVSRQQSRDDEPTLLREIDLAATREILLDIKDAILDAREDGSNVYVTYNCEEYTISAAAKTRLLAAIETQYKSKYGGSHQYEGMSFDERCQDALQRKDQDRLAYLNDVVRDMVKWNEEDEKRRDLKDDGADRTWKVMCDGEELRIKKSLLLGWQQRFNAGAAPSSIDDKVPESVDLKLIRFGFTIAPNVDVTDDLATGDLACVVSIRVSRAKAEVGFNPGLRAYAGVAGTLDGVTITFGTGKVSARTGGALSGTIADRAEETISAKIAGTGLDEPGYDPFADDHLQQKLGEGGGGGGNLNEKTHLSNFNAGAELVYKRGFESLDEKKTGLVVAPNSHFSVWFESAGTLSSVGPDLREMKRLTLASSGMTVQSEGQPVMQLKQVRLDRGGTVKLVKYELLGKAKELASDEEAWRFLFGALSAKDKGAPDALALEHGRQNSDPEFVKGLAKSQIEAKLTAAVQGLLKEHGDTRILDMKLSKIVGM